MSNPTHNCEMCKGRRYAETHPGSILARLWRWHINWCPGWKAYQRSLAERPAQPPVGDTAANPDELR